MIVFINVFGSADVQRFCLKTGRVGYARRIDRSRNAVSFHRSRNEALTIIGTNLNASNAFLCPKLQLSRSPLFPQNPRY
jgi:hypothetical protein